MERASAESIDYLKNNPTGFVTDAFRRLGLKGWMEGILPLTNEMSRIAGRAVTVKFVRYRRGTEKAGPSLYSIIRQADAGDVLVLGALGTKTLTLGENVVHAAIYQSLAGIVVDGCVRDSEEVSKLGLPVFCTGVTVKPPDVTRIAANEPVDCGGARVHPGDIIVGDRDGVVVIPPEHLDEVVKQAKDIAGLEEQQERLILEKGDLEQLHTLLKQKKLKK